jgi:hypothetical protein
MISGAGALYGTVSPLVRGDGFTVLREGARIHLIVGGERRWTIDPDVFGKSARCDVVDAGNEISISLKNGFFPATHLPADFVCRLTKQVGVWMMHIAMECQRDFRSLVVDVALSTAAAPTYFPTHQLDCGTPLIDGGMWANNPIAKLLQIAEHPKIKALPFMSVRA